MGATPLQHPCYIWAAYCLYWRCFFYLYEMYPSLAFLQPSSYTFDRVKLLWPTAAECNSIIKEAEKMITGKDP